MSWMFLFAANFPWKAALQYVSGVTSLLGLCAVLGTALVGYASSLKAKNLAERIGGAGVDRAPDVVLVLKQFTSDQARLDALAKIYNQDRAKARATYQIIKEKVPDKALVEITKDTGTRNLLIVSVTLLLLAVVAYFGQRIVPGIVPDRTLDSNQKVAIQRCFAGKSVTDNVWVWFEPTAPDGHALSRDLTDALKDAGMATAKWNDSGNPPEGAVRPERGIVVRTQKDDPQAHTVADGLECAGIPVHFEIDPLGAATNPLQAGYLPVGQIDVVIGIRDKTW
jgi:hypothetical protein